MMGMGGFVSYSIEKSTVDDLEQAAGELLGRIPRGEVPLRMVFFVRAETNADYLNRANRLREAVAAWYADRRGPLPLITCVAQPPLDCALALELHTLPSGCPCAARKYSVVRKTHRGAAYLVLENRRGKWLLTEGILPTSLEAPIGEQSVEVLEILGEILARESMPLTSIVRQWNYIEQITAQDACSQHYQAFNDARSDLYARTDWPAGYPAATGIGTHRGGVMVEVDALSPHSRRIRTRSLDNALQVAAHDYSKGVLIGTDPQKTTPKFERGKLVSSCFSDHLYVSGTAAIRGERSLSDDEIAEQTVATLENIEYLIGRPNLKKQGIKYPRKNRITIFRVYLKSEEFLDPARKIVAGRYSGVPVLYLKSDICRDELLVEIEGVAKN